MKLDHDLIRALLLLIEDESDGFKGFILDDFIKAFPNENPNAINYHLKYLVDAGLIEKIRAYFVDITPRGRSYLDNIRNPSIWETTKQKFHPLGSVTLEVISEIAKSAILSRLGL